MPILYLIKKQNSKINKIYSMIILSSITTTAISLGTGLINNISKNEKRKTKKIINTICISGIIVSQIGFSNLIKYMYPIFGCLGIVIFIMILSKKNNKNILKKNEKTDITKITKDRKRD